MAAKKSDPIHDALKWVSNHRYTALAAVFSLAVVFFIGCQATAKSPVSNKAMTADELVVERDSEIARLKREATAKVEGAKATLAQLEIEYQTKIKAVQLAIQTTSEEQEATAKRLNDAYAVAGQQIEDKQAFIENLWNTAKATGIADQVPGGAIALGLIGSAFGVGTSADNRRKNKVIANLKGVKEAPAA